MELDIPGRAEKQWLPLDRLSMTLPVATFKRFRKWHQMNGFKFAAADDGFLCQFFWVPLQFRAATLELRQAIIAGRVDSGRLQGSAMSATPAC